MAEGVEDAIRAGAVRALRRRAARQRQRAADWTVIGDNEAARSFGDKLVEFPRSFAGSTSISHAIDFSVLQIERSPLKRVGQPAEVAETVFWVANGSPLMTGKIIELDCGLHLSTTI